MFTIVDYDTQKLAITRKYLSFGQAKEAAEALKVKTGKNYVVVETKSVYSTKTLDELVR